MPSSVDKIFAFHAEWRGSTPRTARARSFFSSIRNDNNNKMEREYKLLQSYEIIPYWYCQFHYKDADL